MQPEPIIRSLEHFPQILEASIRQLNSDELRFRPTNGSWSIAEIVCHLADEEELDFRRRLKQTLENPATAWTPIDPQAWAVQKNYQEQAIEEQFARFAKSRAESVQWLRSLSQPDWNSTHHHPHLGEIRAGDLLTAWAAHDWLHLRQISKRRYEYVNENGKPFTSNYAGEWKA